MVAAPVRGQADRARRADGSRGDDGPVRDREPASGSSIWRGSCRGSRARSRGRGRSPGSLRGHPRGEKGQLIGKAFAAAVAGALLGPVLGGVATVAGTGPTFGAVAAASLGLAAWALLAPASRPTKPQPLRDARSCAPRPAGAARGVVRAVAGLLFGALAVLGPLRLSDLGVGGNRDRRRLARGRGARDGPQPRNRTVRRPLSGRSRRSGSR